MESPKKKSTTRDKSKYSNYCVDLGYEIDGVEDGVVYYKGPGEFVFSLNYEMGDQDFIAIGLQVCLNNPMDLVKNSEVERYVNSTYKIIKCYYLDDSIVLSCEGFDTGSDRCKHFIRYATKSISYAFNELVEKYSGAL